MSTFKILSCTNSKKNGKAGNSKAERSSSKLHKSHKNGPNSPKLPSDCILCFLSLNFTKTVCEVLDKNIIYI